MKAVILSSGGVDSTTCLALAVKKYGAADVATISILYGQKHRRELLAARRVAAHYGARHEEYDLSAMFRGSDSALLAASSEAVPHEGYAAQMESSEGRVATYVPFRNGLMLAAAASAAGSLFGEEEVELYLGAHRDDAAGRAYADCGEDFVRAMGAAVSIGTYGKIHVVAPLVALNKAGVVKMGLGLGVPYELTWSCYEGGARPCGACATCLDRAAAFRANGIPDPALREDTEAFFSMGGTPNE